MKKILAIVLLCCIGASAYASPLVPAGLNPGDQYRLVFVTAGTRDALSTNIEDYNVFVTAEANQSGSLLQGFNATWTALGSTDSVDARDNTGTNNEVETGVAIYTLFDELVAADNADLWDGTIGTPLVRDQFGVNQSYFNAWTGSGANGKVYIQNGVSYGLGNQIVVRGQSAAQPHPSWFASTVLVSEQSQRIYAISSTMTVAAVPVPAAVWLFGSALGLLGWMRRKAA